MQIIVKEINNREDFYPFSLLHSVAEIRCGALRLLDKIKLLFPNSNIAFIGNKSIISSLVKRENIVNNIQYDTPTLVANSNVIIDITTKDEIIKCIEQAGADIIFRDNQNNIVAWYFPTLSSTNINELEIFTENKINIITNNCKTINYIFDVFDYQATQFANDNSLLSNMLTEYDAKQYQSVTHYAPSSNDIMLGKNVVIKMGTILDASQGVIIIDDNAVIMHNSTIIGPCYIGKNTVIKPATIIHPFCSFGPYCKIGGEIEASIFQGYSNKQHHGFMGHSYISEWVNIGAGTSNSDLKNNYSHIKLHLPHKIIDTSRQFLGCFIGDHSKLSINSAINTGSIIGCCVNIAHTDLTNKLTNSFRWITSEKRENYDKMKAINTIEVVMQRRNRKLLQEEKDIILAIEV